MAPIYELRVKGHLPPHWSDWLEGLTVTHDSHGETVLCGPVRDQAALYGLMMKVRDLGLTLVSLNQVEGEAPAMEET
jgi:hypothetical protein